jgi:stage IV sporulation protein A
MEPNEIYSDMANRTGGNIYIGVVGPVRTGKSTFIKRFMETMVIPKIDNIYQRERAKDELPQSGSGRTIMTAEPKFVPEEAVEIETEAGVRFSVRLIDSVGYLVNGAVGQMEDDMPRMVTTPWYDYEIPMSQAAEIGTRKVIAEHSTIGIVVTTDGTITDIPREDYLEAEARTVSELKALGKPFLLLLNSARPSSAAAQSLQAELETQYGVGCLAVDCQTLEESDITDILRQVLYEFPLQEIDLFLPSWVEALPTTHPMKQELFAQLCAKAQQLTRIAEISSFNDEMAQCALLERSELERVDLGSGTAALRLEVPRSQFFQILSEETGISVQDDGDLFQQLTALAQVKRGYDKVAQALEEVQTTGYGIVPPAIEELQLEEPEILKQGGRYGVRLRASAPSIHMMRADIKTVLSPIVGNEKQSEEMINYLLQEFEGDPKQIWRSNIFGKSFYELVNEDLQGKLTRMPPEARVKLRETLQRIINEGSGGLICIIL